MKKFFILFMFALLINVSTIAGEREGGGGIVTSAEFAKTGRQAIELLGLGDRHLNIELIMNEIVEIKVIPVDEICYLDPLLGKKYCEDAHYDSKNNIVLFVFKNWDKFRCSEKLLLSSHEFLRASGMEGEDYKYSSRFLDQSIVQCTGQSRQEQIDCADKVVSITRKIDKLCTQLNNLSANRNKK